MSRCKALAEFGAPEGRGETTRLGPADKPLLLVDESYNANVASMNAAMDVFAPIAAAGRQEGAGARRHAGARAAGRASCTNR